LPSLEIGYIMRTLQGPRFDGASKRLTDYMERLMRAHLPPPLWSDRLLHPEDETVFPRAATDKVRAK